MRRGRRRQDELSDKPSSIAERRRPRNECGTRSSVNAVLNDCIEQQMYYGEKPCYQQYGSNCFYGTQTPLRVAAHYINITDPQYKKVACGLYKTPSGSYHSVQKFLPVIIPDTWKEVSL